MKRKSFVGGTAAVIAGAPLAGNADVISPEAAIARLFTSPTLRSSWFTPALLNEVSLERIRALIAGFVAELGAYASITANGPRYTLTFASGTLQAEASLDADGAFTGLLFSRMQSAAAAALVNQLFAADPVPADDFTPTFLSQITIDKLHAIIASWTAQAGALKSVTPAKDGTYDAQFANGRLAVSIGLAGGKIDTLLLTPG